jgi:LCCL domain
LHAFSPGEDDAGMSRSITLGLLAAAAMACGCGGAPGQPIGWVDNLGDVAPNAVAGERYEYSCPGGGMTGATVWGSDLYTDDSAICPAAVHAGKLQAYGGGTATVEVLEGQQSYAGSTRNGVTSLSFNAWTRSIRFR